jgi:phage-related tail fiber protein
VPTGAIIYHTASSAPPGFLKANGAAISRTTYAALFSVIGTVFGAGDGSTTFNLPDLRGEFLRGWDDGRGVDVGRVFGSAQADSIISHSHNISYYWSSSTNTDGSLPRVTNDSSTHSSTRSTTAYGGSETRPRNIALLACIKY